MVFEAYLPATMSAPLRPPPTTSQIELARMRMVHNVLPTLPLECTYPLLQCGGAPGSFVAGTTQWHEFVAAHGEGVARARRSVAVATPPLPHCTESCATRVITAEHVDKSELVEELLDGMFFHEAEKAERHEGEAFVLDTGAGAATHAAIENAVLLGAGAVYMHHPAASKTIVLVDSGFSHGDMQSRIRERSVNIINAERAYVFNVLGAL